MPRIGLVLSGGMLKGAYQLGALKSISKWIPKGCIKCVSGASIGALNAYAYLTEKLEIAEKLWNLDSQKWGCGNFGRLMQSSYLYALIDEIQDSEDDIDPLFYIPLLNISARKLEYIDMKRSDPKARTLGLKASITLPPFKHAVRLLDSYYYDGALIDNIPVNPLLKEDLDYIICIYFDREDFSFENAEFDQKVIRLNFIDRKQFTPSIRVDQSAILSMIDRGFQKTESVLAELLHHGIEDLEYIHQKNSQVRESISIKKRNYRISGDIIVNRLNRVAKHFVTEIHNPITYKGGN